MSLAVKWSFGCGRSFRYAKMLQGHCAVAVLLIAALGCGGGGGGGAGYSSPTAPGNALSVSVTFNAGGGVFEAVLQLDGQEIGRNAWPFQTGCGGNCNVSGSRSVVSPGRHVLRFIPVRTHYRGRSSFLLHVVALSPGLPNGAFETFVNASLREGEGHDIALEFD